MKERWKQFLKTVATPPTKAILYSYPSTNSRKDRNTEKQDPEMRKREHLLYSKWVDREWEVAIDFGCGTGATFPCFDQQQHQSNLLVGIEPDPSRACAARDYANGLKHVEAVVLCSDISLLENTPNDLFADVILCSQVLGHVPKREFGRIIKCFAARLRTGGSCAIALPVVGASFAEDPTAGGWIPGDDFIHLVYFNRSPFEKDFRKRVPADVFDKYADFNRQSEALDYLKSCGIDLNISPQVSDLEMFQDETKFRQVVCNLIKNALHHRKERVYIRLGLDGERQVLAVSDDGPGIEAEHHEMVFRRYAQVKDSANISRKGHGLGLAGANIISRCLGGQLKLDSEKGKGATFRLIMPLKLEGD